MSRIRRTITVMVVTVIVVTFVNLGLWQIRRHGEVREANAAITARAQRPAATVDALLAEAGADIEQLRYRRARITGRYDVGEEMVLLARSYDGISGHHLVTPLRIDDERAVLVDRGWVPIDRGKPGVADALPPQGDVTVEGIVFPTQTRGRFGPQHPPTGELREIFRIDIPRLRAQFPYEVAPVFVLLQSQRPAQPDRLPRPDVVPGPDAGPHIGYALQWFAFAIILTAGSIVLARSRRGRVEPPGAEPEGSQAST